MSGEDDEMSQIEQLSFFQGKLVDLPETAETSRKSKSKSKAEKTVVVIKEEITAVIALANATDSKVPEAEIEIEIDPRRTKIMNITEPELKIDFEASLAELENVVRELDGEVKLEKALQLFEQGIKLSVECEQFIKGAEAKIEILKKQADGTLTTEPFQGERIDLED